MTIEDFTKLVTQMCHDIESERFEPILEADIAGYVYHLIVSSAGSARQVHLDTRVIQSGSEGDKLDLALGEVAYRYGSRPAVSASAVIEIKVFPKGFKGSQRRVRFEHVLNDDLRKLGSLTGDCLKMELLFDDVGYLQGRYGGKLRLQVICSARDAQAPGAHLVVAQRRGDRFVVEHR